METANINISVRVPKSYSVDLLQQQLYAYAQQLIATVKPEDKQKHHYRHESLCGIFHSDASKEELLDAYLQEKYNL